MKGKAVEALQVLLNFRQDYSAGVVNGVFTFKTQNAVMQFQRAHGLEATGIVTSDTWRKLINGV